MIWLGTQENRSAKPRRCNSATPPQSDKQSIIKAAIVSDIFISVTSFLFLKALVQFLTFPDLVILIIILPAKIASEISDLF